MSQATAPHLPQEPAVAAMLGALVADAAALGLHWIYDQQRVGEIADRRGTAAFIPVRKAHFEGVKGFFAHGARARGMSSQYGECLRLTMRVMDAQNNGFDMSAYQAAFAGHFGMGGAYVGYIDRPTRETVANILAGKLKPSGTDDNQLPALATLPAVVGVLHGQSAMDAAVDDAVSVTHTDAGTLAYCKMFAGLLEDVLDGTKVPVALRRAAAGASGDMGDLLRAALGSSETDSVRYGETTGLTCYLHEGLPLAFHIMNNATDFADAVERNIRAGGDSCGRAIAIGAVMGAQAGVVGLPFPWVNLLDGNAKLFAQARRLTAEG